MNRVPLKEGEIRAVWIDGPRLGSDHLICAVGIDAEGFNHVFGPREGST